MGDLRVNSNGLDHGFDHFWTSDLYMWWSHILSHLHGHLICTCIPSVDILRYVHMCIPWTMEPFQYIIYIYIYTYLYKHTSYIYIYNTHGNIDNHAYPQVHPLLAPMLKTMEAMITIADAGRLGEGEEPPRQVGVGRSRWCWNCGDFTDFRWF